MQKKGIPNKGNQQQVVNYQETKIPQNNKLNKVSKRVANTIIEVLAAPSMPFAYIRGNSFLTQKKINRTNSYEIAKAISGTISGYIQYYGYVSLGHKSGFITTETKELLQTIYKDVLLHPAEPYGITILILLINALYAYGKGGEIRTIIQEKRKA